MPPPHFQCIVAWRALPPAPYFELDPRVIEVLACGHEGSINARSQVAKGIERHTRRSCAFCWNTAWRKRRADREE